VVGGGFTLLGQEKCRKNYEKRNIKLYHRTITAEDDVSHTIYTQFPRTTKKSPLEAFI
jgi:hypothetical protein